MLWHEVTIHTTEDAQEMISNFYMKQERVGFLLKNPEHSVKSGIRVTVNYMTNP